MARSPKALTSSVTGSLKTTAEGSIVTDGLPRNMSAPPDFSTMAGPAARVAT
jgi:hypothetical protein